MRFKKKLTSFFVNLFLVFASFLIALILLESVLRITPYKSLKRKYERKPFKEYIKKDPDLGYDIVKNVKNRRHETTDFNYELFSNEYGCFDFDRAVPDDYSLIIGDSYSWGFAPLESKWTTFLEKKSGRFMLKCGVFGYGTRQELIKAQKVIEQVGKNPKHIILMYVRNDMNDDFGFPYLNKGSIERIDLINGNVDLGLDQAKVDKNRESKKKPKPTSFWRKLRYKTVVYNFYMLKVKPLIKVIRHKIIFGDKMPDSIDSRYGLNFMEYLHLRHERPWISDLITYHKNSIRNFMDYANSVHANLWVIDISGSLDNEVFKDVFVGKENVYYYNLSIDYPVRNQATWDIDGHWNVEGNQEAGKHIYRHFKGIGLIQ